MRDVPSRSRPRHARGPRQFATTSRPLVVLVLALCALPAPSGGQQHGHGFVELRATAYPGTTGDQWQFVQRLRPTFQSRLSDRATLVAVIEAQLAQGRDLSHELRRTIEASALGPYLEQAGCTWPDRGHRVLRVHEAGDYLEVDRLYLDLYRRGYDLRLGRQALHWGSGQYFNPTDPFPEILLAEPWRSRRGVNAARATVPFGVMNDVVAVAAIDDGLHHASVASRLRVNTRGVDLAVSGAWRGDTDTGQVGLDLRGTTLVGWWLEAAHFPGGDAHTELVVGIDYSLPVLDRLVILAQYYRHGAGATDPDRYRRPLAPAGAQLPRFEGPLGSLFAPADPDPFARFTLARDYLLLGARAEINPEVAASAFLLQNLNDGTALGVPTLSYLVSAGLDLSLSAQVPLSVWGEGGELRPRPQDLRRELVAPPGDESLVLDLAGLAPDAVVTFWARLSF
jgi:hypothetical protein